MSRHLHGGMGFLVVDTEGGTAPILCEDATGGENQATVVAVEPHTDQHLNIVKNIAFMLLADTLVE